MRAVRAYFYSQPPWSKASSYATGDWNRFGSNQFLGEISLPVYTLDLTDSADHWYELHDKVTVWITYTLMSTSYKVKLCPQN